MNRSKSAKLSALTPMSKIVFFPLNVAEPLRPAFGRQFANYLREAFKVQPDTETNYLQAMSDIGDPKNPETAYVNFGEELNEHNFVRNLMGQMETDFAVDGLVKKDGDGYGLTLRVFGNEGEPSIIEQRFNRDGIFDAFRNIVRDIAPLTSTTLHAGFIDKMEFGTDSAESFEEFLLGFDAVTYVQQAGRRTSKEFDFSIAFGHLLKSLELDPDFVGPFEALLSLARLCAENGIGDFKLVESSVKKAIEYAPDDWKGHYTLGDIYTQVGNYMEAVAKLEKAIALYEKERVELQKEAESGESVEVTPAEPSLYTRLGLAQQGAGMVANAERTFKKALELEGPEKPTMDWMALLLAQTNRGHEIPGLWKSVIEEDRNNPHAWAKYALALMQNQDKSGAIAAFEEGMKATGDHALVKRYFAPILAGDGQFDRAMDFYEDCLDVTPDDPQLLLEYAKTLESANRSHEVPDVLNAVLNTNPDPNTKANVLAWLYEIEQPKRVEGVKLAQEKAEKEDFAGAVADLEPMIEWMQDYWKPWAMLADLYNRLGRWTDAEKAATHTINLFPGCEPAYVALGTAMMGQGKSDEAFSMLTQVLQANPGSLPVALQLGLAAKATGQMDIARQLARQIREAVGNENIELNQALEEMVRDDT